MKLKDGNENCRDIDTQVKSELVELWNKAKKSPHKSAKYYSLAENDKRRREGVNPF